MSDLTPATCEQLRAYLDAHGGAGPPPRGVLAIVGGAAPASVLIGVRWGADEVAYVTTAPQTSHGIAPCAAIHRHAALPDLLALAARAERAERAEAENICDACAGEGTPVSGLRCMCGGTGKMSDAARWLRSRVLDMEAALAAVETESAAMRDALDEARESFEEETAHGPTEGAEHYERLLTIARAALSGAVGRALLDELARLRRVEEAARKLADSLDADMEDVTWAALCEALEPGRATEKEPQP